MCGIVGYINREKTILNSNKLINYFKQALYCDALRGKHGTGIVAVTKKSELYTFKKALNSSDFLQLETSKAIINDSDNVFMIGHNRHATKGGHTTDNTHPFNHGNIHLVHNGTLNFFKSLTKENFEVDSEAITFMMSKDNPKEVLEKLEGAYSLVWYDSDNNSINFARNEERPMYIGKIKESDSIVFASEKGMISWLASRKDIDLELEEIFSLDVGKLLTIYLDNKNKPRVINFTPKKSTYFGSYYSTNSKGNYNDKREHYLIQRDSINVVPTKWTPYTPKADGINDIGYVSGIYNNIEIVISHIRKSESHKYIGKNLTVEVLSVSGNKGYSRLKKKETSSNSLVKGPGNVFITKDAFLKLVNHGCSYCTSDLTIEDSDDIIWDSNGNPFCCKDCSELKDTYLPMVIN